MGKRLALGLLGSGLLVAGVTRGDGFQGTRFELEERSHIVDATVDRGVATLVVQRTILNTAPRSDQATFWIAVPEAAIATRLRSAGTNAKGERIWFEGELMEAEEAAKKYRELTGIGGYYPKDPALLSWRHQGELALQVFPVPARSTKVVEYTLKLPLSYANGAYRVELLQLGTKDVPAKVRFSPSHAEDSLRVNGIAVSPRSLIEASRPLDIELRPARAPRLDVALASVPFGEKRVLVHARVAAAPKLAEVPENAHIVVLFDNSRSHHDRDVALAAVRAYLGNFNAGTIDFILFDRELRSPIGHGLGVAEALSRLQALKLEPKNGSQLDLALARADAMLRSSPSASRRVVVVTDFKTRSELTPAKVSSLPWQSGAILHLASISSGTATLERDDESPWAALPRKTGGLFWTGAMGAVDKPSRAIFEEWARPKRIDKLTVKGLTGEFAAPSSLDEGQGFDHFDIAEKETGKVEIQGELWSRPYAAAFTPTAEEGKLWSALVFGSHLVSALTESEQMRLAQVGRAVSPVTSYLAIEPGVRPSTEGLDELEASGVGMGGGGLGIGLGSIGTVGHGRAASFDREAYLRARLKEAASGCGAQGREAGVVLEITLDEIVHVGAVELVPSHDVKSETCIRERLWALDLPAAFSDEFASHAVRTAL